MAIRRQPITTGLPVIIIMGPDRFSTARASNLISGRDTTTAGAGTAVAGEAMVRLGFRAGSSLRHQAVTAEDARPLTDFLTIAAIRPPI